MVGAFDDGWSPTKTKPAALDYVGEEHLNTDAIVTLTPPAGAVWAMLQAQAQDIHFRLDGTNPTAATGFFVQSGTWFEYNAPLAIVKFIGAAAGGTLHVMYFK